MMNLGTNAWHAMSDGAGVVYITLDAFDADADFAAQHVDMHAGRYTRLSVRDAGHGMDAATLERIFEPFFTTKASGTGLGLAIVKHVAEAHHGELTVRSEEGRTTFAIRLPAAPP
jgi:signal transduction histidine kinase